MGDTDVQTVASITSEWLKNSPDGAFDLYWSGRAQQLMGNNRLAIDRLSKSISVQSDFLQMHNVCRWDIFWCYAMERKWRQAADVAKKLKSDCKWSPATNAYQYATCLIQIADDEGRWSELRPEIDRTMAEVETLRIRRGGKTFPPEKFAISMSQRYSNGDQLCLPILPLFYFWNVFGNCADNPQLMEPLIELIDDKLNGHQSLTIDNRYLLLLMRGVCLRYCQKSSESIECFEQILTNQKSIQTDTFIPPHAAFELGLAYLESGDTSAAMRWLHKARDEYHGFLVEAIVHVRIHSALKKLKRLESR